MGANGNKIIFNPTPEDLIRINTMAMTGLPVRHIAQSYGMCEETLMKLRRKNPDLDNAIKNGMESGNAILASQLWNGVREGNMTAIIFACKVRLRMSEKNELYYNTNSQTVSKPEKINFAAMSPVEAARVYQQVMKGEK